MAFGLRRTQVFRKPEPRVSVTTKVSDTREGVEIEEVEIPTQREVMEELMAERARDGVPMTATEIRESLAAVEYEPLSIASYEQHLLDVANQIAFDAMSPSDQALQILAGADPDGVRRRRAAMENSAKLKAAVQDAERFQEGHRYE